MPWTNSPFLPSRASSCSICGPPPCTTTGFMPTSLSSTTSCAKSRLQRLVGHGVAAVLHDDGLAVEALDVRQRLGQDARLLGGLRVVVEGRVHRRGILQTKRAARRRRRPFGAETAYWIEICLRCAAAFFGSVSSSTPSRNFASALRLVHFLRQREAARHLAEHALGVQHALVLRGFLLALHLGCRA